MGVCCPGPSKPTCGPGPLRASKPGSLRAEQMALWGTQGDDSCFVYLARNKRGYQEDHKWSEGGGGAGGFTQCCGGFDVGTGSSGFCLPDTFMEELGRKQKVPVGFPWYLVYGDTLVVSSLPLSQASTNGAGGREIVRGKKATGLNVVPDVQREFDREWNCHLGLVLRLLPMSGYGPFAANTMGLFGVVWCEGTGQHVRSKHQKCIGCRCDALQQVNV